MSKGDARYCYSCHALIELSLDGKLGFRATCPKCMVYLHCCKNCKNYQYGLPNHCKVPGTEMVADREANNFCEDFAILDAPQENFVSLQDVENKLFGDSEIEDTKDFSDLFKE